MISIDIRSKEKQPECIIFGDANDDNDAMCVRKHETDGYGTFMVISDQVVPDSSDASAYIKNKQDAENLIKAIQYYIENIGWD